MLLETFRISISLEIFDFYFSDFIKNWGNLETEQQKVGNVHSRYEIYFLERGSSEENVLLAEVGATQKNNDQIEISIAIIELFKWYSSDFVPALGHFFDSKWHDQLVLDDYDNWDLLKGLYYATQALIESRGFGHIRNLDDLPSRGTLPEVNQDKLASLVASMHELLRNSLLRDLQERLPLIETNTGKTSKSTTTGRPGHSGEELYV